MGAAACNGTQLRPGSGCLGALSSAGVALGVAVGALATNGVAVGRIGFCRCQSRRNRGRNSREWFGRRRLRRSRARASCRLRWHRRGRLSRRYGCLGRHGRVSCLWCQCGHVGGNRRSGRLRRRNLRSRSGGRSGEGGGCRRRSGCRRGGLRRDGGHWRLPCASACVSR